MAKPSTEARAFNSIWQGEAMGACRLQTGAKARRQCCISNQVPRVFCGSLQATCPIARPANQRYKSVAAGYSKPKPNPLASQAAKPTPSRQ
jgi:hypothetical protein